MQETSFIQDEQQSADGVRSNKTKGGLGDGATRAGVTLHDNDWTSCPCPCTPLRVTPKYRGVTCLPVAGSDRLPCLYKPGKFFSLSGLSRLMAAAAERATPTPTVALASQGWLMCALCCLDLTVQSVASCQPITEGTSLLRMKNTAPHNALYRVHTEKSIQNSQTFAIWGKKATQRGTTLW